MNLLIRWFPIFDWLPKYQFGDLRFDVQAGLTVAVMIIPQAVAYGLLAGVPPEVALYASLVPMLAYVVMGTCRELSVGPAALISLMTGEAIITVAPEATADPALWTSLAILLAVLVGAFQLGLGMVRMGLLVNFISRPVVNGFMSAAALIIGASQLGLVLGQDLPRGSVFEIAWAAGLALPSAHWLTVGVAVACMAVLVLGRIFAPKLPAAFVVVVIATAVTWLVGLDEMGLAIVGDVQGGLPVPKLPIWPGQDRLLELLPYAVTIGLVGFLESISIAKTYGFQHRYDVDSNQELRAIGVGNLLGGLFGAYVATGNISRTVVSAQAGVRSQLAAVVTASIVLLTVVLIAPAFTYLPKAALASIIIIAVIGIIDYKEPIRLFGFKRNDALALLTTFAATLLFGVEIGILTGIGSALALHLWQTSIPHWAILGRIPGTQHYRDINRYPEAIIEDELIVLRVDESLYFASAAALKDAVEHAHNVHEDVPVGLILDCGAINDLDASALDVLETIADELTEAGTRLALAGVSGPVYEILEASHVLDHVGAKNVYIGVHEAVQSFRAQVKARRSQRLPTHDGAPPRIEGLT